jgi:hypothetical protein
MSTNSPRYAPLTALALRVCVPACHRSRLRATHWHASAHSAFFAVRPGKTLFYPTRRRCSEHVDSMGLDPMLCRLESTGGRYSYVGYDSLAFGFSVAAGACISRLSARAVLDCGRVGDRNRNCIYLADPRMAPAITRGKIGPRSSLGHLADWGARDSNNGKHGNRVCDFFRCVFCKLRGLRSDPPR